MGIKGKGRRVIADELNAMGIDSPSGKGKTWGITSVRNILLKYQIDKLKPLNNMLGTMRVSLMTCMSSWKIFMIYLN